ncbi:shikimate transporter [Arthrobacter sp. Hiyo6]|nr:shikimate transporter [Arthrobacter sp. Hiyo6]
MSKTQTTIPGAVSSANSPQNQPKRAAASGAIGSALEYYEFFIYAQAAALVFPQLFFPSEDRAVGVIAAFATYGVGYAARPIGALILGHLGDRRGRKNLLVICMVVMGVCTLLIGLLPTYASVGLWAPALLVTLRIVQGLALGGEMSGANAMIMEHAPFGRRGFFSSFTLMGTQAGQLVAAAVLLPLAALLPEESFNSWGWRIPFLLSAFVVIAGYIIRRKVREPEAFVAVESAGDAKKHLPIVDVFKHNWRALIRVAVIALMGVIPTTISTFGAAYATQKAYGIGMTAATYLWIPILANLVAICVIPFVGNLSDKIGRRPLIAAGSLLSGASAFGYLYFIGQGNVAGTIISSIIMWGVFFQGYNAVFPSFFQEMFPTRTRVTGFAVSFNVGTVFTAFAPTLFAAIALPGTNIPLIIGGITFGVAVVAAIAVYTGKETSRIPLDALGNPCATPVSDEEYAHARAHV